MDINKLQSYQDVLEYLRKADRRKHFLFGNGFSIAYDPKIFSYNALSSFIEKTDNALLKKLFSVINTKNFELIMQQLDTFIELAKAFSTEAALVAQLQEASETLKNSLIEAVRSLHPEHVFTIPDAQSQSCFDFLKEYLAKNGYVFSTNYDLLPYWVLMRNDAEASSDGFGRDMLNADEVKKGADPEYSDLTWGKYKDLQTFFYLHGSLPLFDDGVEIVKEVYNSEHYLLRNVSERMTKKQYPVFVTAGNAQEKFNHIMHNKYLAYCYDKLCTIDGSLITFGFNFGPYDTHIIDAINKASVFHKGKNGKLLSIYIGVFSQADVNHIEEISGSFACKVNMYDARTANIWGK